MHNIKKIYILGIDGAGRSVWNVQCDNLNKLAQRGVAMMNATTVFPSISAECWSSLLMSVSPSLHNNTHDNIQACKQAIDDQYPTIFNLVSQHLPDWKLASFCNWSPINHGIIEDIDTIEKVTADSDADIINKSKQWIIDNQDVPSMFFLHLDEIDAAGHEHDYGSNAYYNQVKRTDEQLGSLLDTIYECNNMDETLIFAVTDHGGGFIAKNHGSDNAMDMNIFIIGAGGMFTDAKINFKSVNIMDITPFLLTQLDINVPAYMEGCAANICIDDNGPNVDLYAGQESIEGVNLVQSQPSFSLPVDLTHSVIAI